MTEKERIQKLEMENYLGNLKEQIKQQKELISEQVIQLDYLKDENWHIKTVLDENKQLKERIKELESFIKKIADINGNILLINGYGYNIKKVLNNE